VKTFLTICALLGITALFSGFDYLPHFYKTGGVDTLLFKKPVNFPEPIYRTDKNRVTAAGFLLGKTLFYDPALSADHTIACGNCHQASAAFANLGSAVSTGIKECKGTRNAPALINLAWQKEFMLDGRINDLEMAPVNALTNPCEMGNTIPAVLNAVRSKPDYRAMFIKAFHDTTINESRVLKALTQFTVMLVSANSKYDRYKRKEKGMELTADEKDGYAIFQKKCNVCHTEPLFTDFSYRNNGLDETYKDIGRDSLTHKLADKAKFRVPTLRNIEITGPYMHDGRFYKLKEVLQHYDSGVKKHQNLDPLFNANSIPGIRLSADEQVKLMAFLKTLTDVEFINDRRFNNN
jgi:cytochrome c peroxidase